MLKALGKSQEQFLNEMEAMFGKYKYDFSKAVYTGARKPLEVVCKEHGSFYPMPTNLLKGRGCSTCGKIKGGLKIRKDNQFFIEKSKEAHGDRYDYSKVNYTGNDKPVEIVCSEHGSFFQAPCSHYVGSGCPNCVSRNFQNLSELWRSIDLSLSKRWELLSTHNEIKFKITDKVKILCTEHNKVFESNFFCLLKRKSCCDITRYEMMGESQKIDSSVYKTLTLEVHGETYEYPEYPEGLVGLYDKINILCKEHGVFSQTFHHHTTRRQGCPECAKVTRGISKTEKWLVHAVEKIEDALAYDEMYTLISNSNVKNSKDHFMFSCAKHGGFGKTYGNFIQGQRCPECNIFEGWGKSAYIDRANAFYDGMSNIYLIRVYNNLESFYKVGITFHHDLRKRFTKFDMPYKYEKLQLLKYGVKEIIDFETYVHKANKPYHYSPSIKFGGSVRECFTQEGLESTIEMFNDFKEKFNV